MGKVRIITECVPKIDRITLLEIDGKEIGCKREQLGKLNATEPRLNLGSSRFPDSQAQIYVQRGYAFRHVTSLYRIFTENQPLIEEPTAEQLVSYATQFEYKLADFSTQDFYDQALLGYALSQARRQGDMPRPDRFAGEYETERWKYKVGEVIRKVVITQDPKLLLSRKEGILFAKSVIEEPPKRPLSQTVQSLFPRILRPIFASLSQ
jgi:hypothetical protein